MLVAATVVLYLVAAPLVLLLVSSVKATGEHLPFEAGPLTLNNYATVFLDVRTYVILGNTALFAVGVLAEGFALALIFAWLVDRTNLPLRNVVFALVLVPMAIPGMLAAIGWILLLGPGAGVINVALRGLLGLSGNQGPISILTLGGMIFVEGLRMVPTMFLMLTAALRMMDPSLEEQSRVAGRGPFATARHVTFPVMLPALLAAFIYFAIATAESFEVPGVLGFSAGVTVFSTQIFWATHPDPGLPDYGLASTLSLVLLGAAILMLSAYFRLTRHAERYRTITGRGYRPRTVDLGVWRYPALAGALVYLIVAVVLPFLVLFWGSLFPFFQAPSAASLARASFRAYASALNYPGVGLAVTNTLILALTAATVTVGLVTLTSSAVVHTKLPGRRLLDVLTFLPQAVPGVVVGLAVLLVYLSFPNPLYGTIWVVAIGVTTKYLAFSSRTIQAAYVQIHQELIEAAQVCGSPWQMTLRRVTAPLVAPALVNAWIWTFVHGMRDLTIPLMLSTPQNVVVSTLIWNLWDGGHVPETCVLAVGLIVLLGTVTFTARILVERRTARYAQL
jgi:iron(III) transport system permease protein